jgi:hypothetical protein
MFEHVPLRPDPETKWFLCVRLATKDGEHDTKARNGGLVVVRGAEERLVGVPSKELD